MAACAFEVVSAVEEGFERGFSLRGSAGIVGGGHPPVSPAGYEAAMILLRLFLPVGSSRRLRDVCGKHATRISLQQESTGLQPLPNNLSHPRKMKFTKGYHVADSVKHHPVESGRLGLRSWRNMQVTH